MFRFLGCAVFAVLCLNAEAAPPLVSHLLETKESYSDVSRRSNGDMYTVVLAHIPHSVTADDFESLIVDNRFLKVEIKNSTYDWYMNLLQSVPNGLKLTPSMEVQQLSGDNTGAAWKVSTLVPKYFYPALRQTISTTQSGSLQPSPPGIMPIPIPVAMPVAQPGVGGGADRQKSADRTFEQPAVASSKTTVLERKSPDQKTIKSHLPITAPSVNQAIPLFDG